MSAGESGARKETATAHAGEPTTPPTVDQLVAALEANLDRSWWVCSWRRCGFTYDMFPQTLRLVADPDHSFARLDRLDADEGLDWCIRLLDPNLCLVKLENTHNLLNVTLADDAGGAASGSAAATADSGAAPVAAPVAATPRLAVVSLGRHAAAPAAGGWKLRPVVPFRGRAGDVAFEIVWSPTQDALPAVPGADELLLCGNESTAAVAVRVRREVESQLEWNLAWEATPDSAEVPDMLPEEPPAPVSHLDVFGSPLSLNSSGREESFAEAEEPLELLE